MISLIAKWWVKSEFLPELEKDLIVLAENSRNEPGVLIYNIHNPLKYLDCDKCKVSIRNRPGTIIFYEKYSDMEAFEQHSNGENLKKFVQNNKDKFILDKNLQPYIEVDFLSDII